MDRVAQVDANAAVHVLRDVADAMARFTGQVGRGQRFAGRRQAGIEAVAQLPQRAAQGFQGDMGVGHAHLHGLEAADAPLELLTLAEVIHGAADLLGADAQLQRSQGGDRPRFQPGQRGAGQYPVGSDLHALDQQVGDRFAVAEHARCAAHGRVVQVEQQQPHLAVYLHRHQGRVRLTAQGDGGHLAVDLPAFGAGTGAQGNAAGSVQAVQANTQQPLALGGLGREQRRVAQAEFS
ncbi:hypothetical protein D3C79_517860 [compost metagenome]